MDNSLYLGETIQNLRTQHGFSVRALAARAGITPSMLSQLENDRVMPSIQTLRALAEALNVPLYEFFRESHTVSPVVTPGKRAIIGRKTDPDTVYELLTPTTKGSIEFCMMIVPPYSQSNGQPQSHEGEEVAFFHSGTAVELELDGVRYPMRPGDSVRIPPRTNHLWHNNTDQAAQILFALTPPSF